jgi:hypothetical protein
MLDRPGYLQAPLIVAPIDGKHVSQLLTFQVSTSAAIFFLRGDYEDRLQESGWFGCS